MFHGIGKGKRNTGSKKPSFRDKLNDTVHGGHVEDGILFLSPDLGNGQYPLKEAGPWTDTETDGIRIYCQPMDLKGSKTGPLLISENPVPMETIEKIFHSNDLSGMIGAFAFDESNARSIMNEIGIDVPFEYNFTLDLFEHNYMSLRQKRFTINSLPGPMCLYGPYNGHVSDLDSPNMEQTKSELILGIHEHDDKYILARDLGGLEFEALRDVDELSTVKKGCFRIMIDTTRMNQEKGGMCFISNIDISQDTAISICSDAIRVGIVNVYTPDREDARKLILDSTGKKPKENHAGPRCGLNNFESSSGLQKARAFYGLF